MQPPSVRFYRPDPRLQPYLTAYYFMELPPSGPLEDLLMPEWSGIRFVLRGDWSVTVGGETLTNAPATLFGHSSRAGLIRCENGGLGMGVGVLPLGWTHLIGLAPADYVDRAVEAAPLLGPAILDVFAALQSTTDDASRNSLCDAFFLDRLAARPAPDPQVIRAHEVINDPQIGTTEEFAAALGVSARHASRLSVQLFGFPPKLLLRRARFLRTLGVIRDDLNTPWVEQLDPWYYDQSHFVRDFQDFMGLSPTAYFSSRGVMLRAAGQARAKALGQSLQGLHPASQTVSDSSKRASND